MKKLLSISFIIFILVWNIALSILAVAYYETLENRMKVLADAMYVDISEKNFKRQNGLPYHGYENITFEVNDVINIYIYIIVENKNIYIYYCRKQIQEGKQ